MTKIKNTKKGMAKKTLSMSLVVAMLATSNVPVWAAEFSDGSDVAVTSEAAAPVAEDTEAFSDETVDAPVVDDAAEEVSTAQVAADYTLNTNMELKSGTWKDKVTLAKKDGVTDAAKFEISKNGVPVDTSKITYEVYYNDDINVKATTLPTVSDSMELTTTAPELDAFTGGKKVTVKFYVDGEKEAVATFETQLKAVDLSTAAINYTSSEDYNGKIQRPAAADLTVTLNGETVGSDAYVVKFENSEEAKNHKAKAYNFAVEGVAEKGYTGTSTYHGSFAINTVKAKKDNLSVVVSGTTTYNSLKTVPTVVVTDKLSGAVIPSELYTVSVDTDTTKTGSQVDKGDYKAENVTVTMKEHATVGTVDTYNNFKDEAVDSECVTGSFKIEALDLSKLGDKYTVQVKPQKVAASAVTLGWDQVILTDKATGKVVVADTVLPTDELTPVLTNNATAGKGRLTIKVANVTNQNIINEYVTDVAVANNVISEKDIALPKGTKLTSTSTPLAAKTKLTDKVSNSSTTTLNEDIQAVLNASVYTGSALEPLKAVFENIVWSGDSPSGTDMKFTLGKDYTITYAKNIDSDVVKGADKDDSKKATVTLQFMGDYVGSVSYTFDIAQATAYVSGEKISYTAGKNSYDANVKVVTKSGTTEIAVPTTEYVVKTTQKARKIGDYAWADVVFTNPNYKMKLVTVNNGTTTTTDVKTKNVDNCVFVKDVKSELVGKSLTDASVTATVDGTYTYTGKAITPKLTVKDGSTELKLDTDYKIVSKTGTEAGDAYVTIEGINNYAGKLTLKYTITKADLANATVESSKTEANKKNNYDKSYDGLAQKPDIKVDATTGKIVGVKIGDTVLTEYDPTTKTGDFELTWNLDAVEVGTYDFTLTAVASSKKVQGTFKGTYKVIPSKLTTQFIKKADKNVAKIETIGIADTGVYYTGKAITVADFKTKVAVYDTVDKKILTEGKDYRLEYSNNVDAGLATVKAYGLGNHAYKDENGKEVAIATLTFNIEAKGTIDASWIKKISDVEYAGGLPVEPEVVVADAKGNRLVQGVDYTVETAVKDVTADGANQIGTDITIKGKGAYVAGDADNAGAKANASLTWKVTKKDLANTAVSVDKENNVTVLNGTVIVPAAEYDVKFSDDKKKVTVTAKADSKNYKGSKEITVESAKVGQAMISNVVVKGNTVTPVLSSEVDEAVGYDYVIATEEDYKNGRVDISKNILKTNTDFHYVQQGTYYAYCHAWKRNAEGKKVFGEWSNIVKFTVTATTPSTPTVKSVKVKGSTVTVTYTVSEDATGYDVVLGSAVKKVNGEKRPVDYGTLVKKNIKGNVVTATFKNVPAGKYYAGVHSFNKTSENGSKVFSKWSNSKAVTVK